MTNSEKLLADKSARRDALILEHLPLVKAVAARVYANLPAQVDLNDLVQCGIVGLIDATTKFDSNKQVAFSTYAKHRIRGAILDSLREADWASRDMRRRQKQVNAARHDLLTTLQRAPTEIELAEKLGTDVDRLRVLMLDVEKMGPVSADSRADQFDDLPAPDLPGKPATEPDFIFVREELRGTLGAAIQTLPERYQKVIQLYYDGELTMKEIGTVLSVNESRVSQLHKSALQKLAIVMRHIGIKSCHAFLN